MLDVEPATSRSATLRRVLAFDVLSRVQVRDKLDEPFVQFNGSSGRINAEGIPKALWTALSSQSSKKSQGAVNVETVRRHFLRKQISRGIDSFGMRPEIHSTLGRNTVKVTNGNEETRPQCSRDGSVRERETASPRRSSVFEASEGKRCIYKAGRLRDAVRVERAG